MNFNQLFPSLISWLLSRGIKVVVILFVAWLVTLIAKIFISKITKAFLQKSKEGDRIFQPERLKTLLRVFNSSMRAVVWLIALMMVLPEVGVNIAPLLAGAGIVGLAIGMGARTLIQDYLSGIYILLEDHYRVGEEVTIGGVKGTVKELTLRKTILKDAEGVIHYIPNGQATKVSNHSRNLK